MKTSLTVATTFIVIVGGIGGTGLFAFFSDQALSSANLIDTATVDLQIDGQESILAFIGGTDLLPGECVSGSTVLSNAGTRFGAVLVLDMWIDHTDTDDLGAYIEISELDYGAAHPDLQATIADGNGNGWPDLADWTASPGAVMGLTEPGAAGTTVFVELCLRTEADNHLQDDGVTIAIHFLLRQPADIGALPSLGTLVSHWSFEEGAGTVAADGVGMNPGTLLNGASFAAGKQGSGLLLDGVDDYVNVPDAASLDLATYTAAAWVKRGTTGDTWYTVLSKGPMTENYGMFVHRTGNYVHHAYNVGGSRFIFDTPSNAAMAETWTHVAITYDGTAARTFIDGVLWASQSNAGTASPNAKDLRIGHRESSSHFMRGTIDEVVIYNSALTALQIQDLMIATS